MSELNEQMAIRREKLDRLRELGVDVYPHEYDYDLFISEVKRYHDKRSGEDLEADDTAYRVPGRILSVREHGKVVFLDLSDGLDKIQVYLKKNVLGEEPWQLVKLLDIGDHVGVTGTLFRTRTDELTLAASEITFLAKAHRPLPEKWHGLADVELRYRKRYLDLMVNPEVRALFIRRAEIIDLLRDLFRDRGYLEVETPMMHTIPGGATARPFTTHHNALDMDLYMRVAPELFLKRLIVAGMPRVFEINRSFRNEGISTRHNPEFTMLEFYEAYSNFENHMAFTEEILSTLVERLTGGLMLTYGDHEIDFTPPWPRVSIPDTVKDKVPGHPDPTDREALAEALREAGLPVKENASVGHLMMDLFDHYIEETLIQPTFVTNFPVEVSPLAKGEGSTVHRFELIIAGMELANAYCELNDPEEQKSRFEEQVASGEGRVMDHDFVEALEYGMPPTAGEGIGIDRLVMLLTNQTSIREVILFPLLKPQDSS